MVVAGGGWWAVAGGRVGAGWVVVSHIWLPTTKSRGALAEGDDARKERFRGLVFGGLLVSVALTEGDCEGEDEREVGEKRVHPISERRLEEQVVRQLVMRQEVRLWAGVVVHGTVGRWRSLAPRVTGSRAIAWKSSILIGWWKGVL